jgi:RimJ/RimL family protein N-acetyltransferase
VRWQSLPEYRAELARDRDVCIEPLCSGHIDALLDHVLSDPHIALMANLPDMATRQQMSEWMDEESGEAGRCSYAVVQADLGPIGVVSYRRVASAAYFYFWIGSGVQGAGLGSRAARLLFAQAKAAGVTDMFTSTFVDNVRSSRALVRVGFDPLVVAETEEGVRYFHASLVDRGASIGEFTEQLTRLCDAIGSPV